MTASISILPRANAAARPHASSAFERLARLEAMLERSIAACQAGSEREIEGTLMQGVAMVAHLFGAADPAMTPDIRRRMAEAYDACLRGLSDACAGDIERLPLALGSVRAVRIALEPCRPGPSTMPRAA
ncbi:MAG: hypothetical protein KF764_32730 [Labilithrix sp.]|nr:hypothetical protein [Labilithrix sp.]MBX3220173.1 hypothetical protein [Labilithrix sp.]